ncbi:protein kinase domain-containing protein [Mesorhizobium helmanticense]|uniref:non-specific serine/threonine protein kinase n=1 Tax=Mesorhizobium helmanticense TaxID=1776423 RepID=A0A2T4ISS0_9HYPH|nr:protein kinase [Mesorhizobium helmanticense]PTE08709.1 protein kinase [Mesorhizobium helmanticense]
MDIVHDNSEIVGFVEEYIEGTDLKPIEVGAGTHAALRAMYSIVSGISDVHRHGRVHRDIKPDNMKIDSSGVLKIFDFGLAKLSNGAKTKQLFFTPFYAAPEIFVPDSAGNHVFTAAVDIFAFGVTALWLLNAGSLPSELGHVPPSIPKKSLAFNSTIISVPVEIAYLLNSTLNYDPAERPDAEMLRTALGKHLLFDKHRMLITYSGNDHFVDAANRTVTLTAQGDGVTISYDGLDFVVTHVSGHVRHNNRQVIVGYKLQGAAVIVLGDPSGDRRLRTSITADISHPEVMN